MDTKLKKMTANIKGIKGWFVLTVLGLDVLLGIDGGGHTPIVGEQEITVEYY